MSDDEDNSQLSNKDFRKFLSEKRASHDVGRASRGGSSNHDEESGEKKENSRQRQYKKWMAKLAMKQKAKELKNKYRDRAEERRKQSESQADFAETEQYQEMSVEDTRYLGGDIEHTHLVKGLDFALLQKVRDSADKEEEKKIEEAFQQQMLEKMQKEEEKALRKKKKKKKVATSSNMVARLSQLVFFSREDEDADDATAASSSSSSHSSSSSSLEKSESSSSDSSYQSLFANGEMSYEFNLDPYEEEKEVPISLMNPISETSEQNFFDERFSGRLPKQLFGRITHLFGLLRGRKIGGRSGSGQGMSSSPTEYIVGADGKRRRKKKKGGTQSLEKKSMSQENYGTNPEKQKGLRLTAFDAEETRMQDEKQDNAECMVSSSILSAGFDPDEDIFAGVGTKIEDSDNDVANRSSNSGSSSSSSGDSRSGSSMGSKFDYFGTGDEQDQIRAELRAKQEQAKNQARIDRMQSLADKEHKAVLEAKAKEKEADSVFIIDPTDEQPEEDLRKMTRISMSQSFGYVDDDSYDQAMNTIKEEVMLTRSDFRTTAAYKKYLETGDESERVGGKRMTKEDKMELEFKKVQHFAAANAKKRKKEKQSKGDSSKRQRILSGFKSK